ncbi:MAG: HAMP domain-containing sensor histidine kinase [Planctomycetaceae bacterium]
MFFLRSIRRRLVTGFTIALTLMLVMAAAGIVGLVWHQDAVAELEELLLRQPDRDRLMAVVAGIPDTLNLNAQLNLKNPDALQKLRHDYHAGIVAAEDEFQEFRRKLESIDQTPEMFRQQGLIYSRLLLVERDLVQLRQLQQALQPGPDPADVAPNAGSPNAGSPGARPSNAVAADTVAETFGAVIIEASRLNSEIRRTLSTLPAFHDSSQVLSSLGRERRRSERLLKLILILTPIAVALYGITILFGFRWISQPLRTIARGASRIGHGDIGYRIPSVSRWNDEFANLTENVNRMADRFQQSEESLQAKVEERSRQLIRSERLAGIGFLAAGVAHEINNPLSAITMAAESLQNRLYDVVDPGHPDEKEMFDRLSMIQRESRRCGEITARILNFSRGENAEKAMDDLTRIVGEVLAIIRPMDRYRDRTITFERVEPLMVEINGSQIKQVVLNLVANALQATQPGGHVEIRLLEQIDWVIVEVQDDGSGMSTDTIRNLFEPFYTTKETGQGTGLGLSITHRIVEDHDGTIDPISAGAGQGSLFRVRLPKRQSQQNAA